jgi:unsaturated rhamnogalacturonyl hydrolase
MKRDDIRDALARLAAHASAELLSKQPHWGDAIQCDGLVYASHALRLSGPRDAAERWFTPRLARGPDLKNWFWFWSAEALAAIDLHLATRKSAYLDYARAIVNAFESKATRTADGAVVPHPPALEVWVDVAYFTAPAMAALGRITGDAALVERALSQVLVHHRHLIDGPSGLFWHVAYVEKNMHSACRWARGNSWFSLAATEVLRETTAAGLETRLAARTAPIRDALARQLNAVVALQDASGLWHTVIDRADSYLESSAAAGFALAVGRALETKLPGLDTARAADCYRRALDAICAKIDSPGEFSGVSQQTPPGEFDHYNSIALGTASFGTGVCMMALSEALETAR